MQKFNIELKWALISMLFVWGWMAMERIVGLHSTHIHLHPYLTMLSIIPFLWIIYSFFKDKRENYFDGKMNYKQSLMAGLVFTVLNVLFTPLTQWVTSTVITPHYFENVINYAVSNKLMTLESAQSEFNLKSYMMKSTMMSFIFGIIMSSIFSLFMKNK